MNYIKLAGWSLVLILFGFLGLRWRDAVYKAGANSVQILWDADREGVQKAADEAIKAANKARDDALEANEGIRENYETQLLAAHAGAAQFAQRLRNAEVLITAGRGSVSKTDRGQGSVPASGPTSADQLGQLVALVTDLRAECTANADRNDAAYKELSPQVIVR